MIANWDGLDLATLEFQVMRLEEKRDAWKTEYDRLHGQMEALKAWARGKDGAKGVSNPTIGTYGRALQKINQGGYLKTQEALEVLKGEATARRKLLDLRLEADILREDLQVVVEQNQDLKGTLQIPEFPAAKGFDSESYVQQQIAQVQQLKKALRANELEYLACLKLKNELDGKHRAEAGHYASKVRALSKGIKDQIMALSPTIMGLEKDTQDAQIAVLAIRTSLDTIRDEIDMADELLKETKEEAAAKTSWWKRWKFAQTRYSY